ncbi:MAG TPA: cation:proton antiporter [Anaeromyxobacteraceae bacterium]|nr:cation:proton antiporter [Anaeromyxobacteraceae bacterium]
MRHWPPGASPRRLAPAAALIPAVALASAGADPVTPLALALAVILAAAKLCGELAVRLGQPAVLGELLAGALLGNLHHLGFHALDFLRGDPSLAMLAHLGVLILLFEVGLESTVGEMARVGLSSLLVAVVGVATPFALGYGVGVVLVPSAGPLVHAFLGATLCATSVGITARVLKDLGRSRSDEARIILGAAVIDDVLGLVILAVVSGAVAAAGTGTSVSWTAIAAIVGKSAAFLGGAIALGRLLVPPLLTAGAAFQGRWTQLSLGLALAFGFSWLAGFFGLAPIVGAFAAGLVLEPDQSRAYEARGERSLEDVVHPISAFLVPIFFVGMGMNTDLASFGRTEVLGLAAALTVAGVAGKLASGLGVLQRGVDRLAVGVGMVPRGEVGLIFAGVGLRLSVGGRPLVDAGTYSAIVILVVVTTLVTPPALRATFARRDRRAPGV